MLYLASNSLTFSALPPHIAAFPYYARGRNAHKKRANIHIKSESTKLFALFFKQLAHFNSLQTTPLSTTKGDN